MNRIRELRCRNNYSQDDLAALVGVDRSTVSKWESGSSFPRKEKMMLLLGKLGCTLDELVSAPTMPHDDETA